MPAARALALAVGLFAAAAPAAARSSSFIGWGSPQSYPVDLAPDGRALLAAWGACAG